MAATDELAAPDDRTLVFRLKRPFPLLPEALGRASSLVPVIMPERLTRTDPFAQGPETVGSGPFRHVAGERVPGARIVYEKHAAYRPRPDGTPSFTAGPRVAYLDRLVFNVMPNPAAAALQAGSVDWIEQPLIDLLPALRRSRDVAVEVQDPSGMLGHLRFNHLHPPFNNPAVRRLVLAAVSQADCMTAVAGEDRSLWRDGLGVFAPGSPMTTDSGMEARAVPRDLPALKQALAGSGHGGERVVMLAAAEVPRIAAVSEVARDLLARLGMNVDYVQADWGTIGARTTSRQPGDQGGWSCYRTYVSGLDVLSPATRSALRGNGLQGPPGWPTLPCVEALRGRWFQAQGLAAQQGVARALQLQAWEGAPFVPLGQLTQPVAYRKGITGMLKGVPVFTDIRKE